MKYRHLRRTVIAVLGTLAFLLVVVVVVRATLQSRLVRGWAVQRLQSHVAGSLGGHLEVGDFDWGVIPPRALLSGVTLDLAGLHLEVERASVDLLRLRLTSRAVDLGDVVLDGITVRTDGVLKQLDERSEGSRTRVSARHLDVRRLDFEGLDLPGFRAVEMSGFEMSWTAEEGIPRGWFAGDEVMLDVSGIEKVRARVKGRFEVTEGLVVPHWSVQGEGFVLSGSAAVGPGGGFRARLAGDVDLGAVNALVGIGDLLEGEVAVEGRVATAEDDVIRVDVSAPWVVAAGFRVDRLRGTMALGDNELRGTVTRGVFAGGRLRGDYTLGRLARPFPHTVDATLESVDVAELLWSLGVPPAGMVARADVGVGLQWTGMGIGAGQGRGRATLRVPAEKDRRAGNLPVSGVVEASLDRQNMLLFASRDLRIGGSAVEWQGPLTLGSWEPAWSVHASPAVVEEIVPMVNTWIGDEVLPDFVAGSGDLHVGLSGPWRRLRVSTRLDARRLAIGPVELDRVVAEALVRESEVVFGPVRYQIGDGQGELEGRLFWGDRPPQIDLATRGQAIPISTLASWLDRQGAVEGRASFTGGVHGPMAAPRASWAVGLTDVSLGPVPLGDGSATVSLEDETLSVHGLTFENGMEGWFGWQVLSNRGHAEIHWPHFDLGELGGAAAKLCGDSAALDLEMEWSDDELPTGWLRASSDGAHVEALSQSGEVTMVGSVAGGATFQAALELAENGAVSGRGSISVSAVDKLLQRLSPDSATPLTGGGLIDCALDWPVAGAPRVTAWVSDLDLSLDDRPVTLVEPVIAVFDEEGLRTDRLRLAVGGDELGFRGGVAADGSLTGRLGGTVDALLLRMVAPEWETAGRVSGELDLLGSLDDVRLQGIAEVAGGSFRLPASRKVVSAIDGTVVLSPEEVVLDGVDFRFMNGSGRASGRIHRRGDAVELALNGAIEGLIYPLFSGFEPRLTGSWNLIGPVGDLELSGDLVVDRAAVVRRDDLAELALDWIEESARPTPAVGLDLDLHFEAERTITARGPFLNAAASASLDLSGTPGRPGLTGKLELQEGGDFTFKGVRYEIERGTFTFTDPGRIDPIIQFEARAWVQSYVVTLRLSGTLDRLSLAVSSDPPLDEEGIYSLLALGYRSETIGTGGFGVSLASTVLTRQINAELERRARLILPVDQVRVDPFLESSTGNPAARMTVTKQLNPKWTVILQSSLSSEREEVVISRWYLAPGLFVEAIRDLDGTIGVDLKLRKRY